MLGLTLDEDSDNGEQPIGSKFNHLCPRREEILAQSKVGGIAARTRFDQLFVQYKCTVMDEIDRHYLQLSTGISSLRGPPD